jgi:hypothetical protein
MLTDKTLGAFDIADLRELARRRLPRGVFEFFDRGNGDEAALTENRAAFERLFPLSGGKEGGPPPTQGEGRGGGGVP